MLHAAFNDEQKKITQRCCQIAIDSLMRIAADYDGFTEELLEQDIPVSEEEVLKEIEEKIGEFQRVILNPNDLFTMPKPMQDLVEHILLDIDKCDGNEHINGIWAKFFTKRDFNKYVNPN